MNQPDPVDWDEWARDVGEKMKEANKRVDQLMKPAANVSGSSAVIAKATASVGPGISASTVRVKPKQSPPEKTIYELELGEEVYVGGDQGFGKWRATRVPGGWIFHRFQEWNSGAELRPVFVPMNLEFATDQEKMKLAAKVAAGKPDWLP